MKIVEIDADVVTVLIVVALILLWLYLEYTGPACP